VSSRDIILQRLRQRTGGPRTVPECDFSVLQRPDWSTAERIDRFRRAIESVHGEVHLCRETDWVDRLAGLLRARGARNLLLGRNHPVSEAVRASTHPDLPPLRVYDRPIEQWQPELFNDVDAGLTSTRGGIAETGSLILWPTPDEPRLLSLVPPIHVAVLYASELYPTLYDAMHAQAWAAGMPTNALLISGPSKTADIEQTLAYGVHGPKELIVLVVE
jgi:L-lactate dehydrogenase complex protein LldG|tara:strand:+ start:84 stop:737 length:654 start_codon:yes stop_codon:yes gene_type:complete